MDLRGDFAAGTVDSAAGVTKLSPARELFRTPMAERAEARVSATAIDPGDIVCAASQRNRTRSGWRVPPPDTRLIRRAVAGDPAAAQDLFGLLRPIVLGYCRKRLGEGDLSGAEDCTQDVMFAVLAVLPKYGYRPDKFLSWVFGIAAHKIADLHRARHRNRELFSPLPEPDAATDPVWTVPAAADEFARLDEELRVSRVLHRLPPAYREVLTLRLGFGYTAEETAKLLEMPSAAVVRVTQHRALRRIRLLAHVAV